MKCINFKKCMKRLVRIGEGKGEYMLTTLKTIVSNEMARNIFEKNAGFLKDFCSNPELTIDQPNFSNSLF